jgi:hypothetical protein
MRRRRSPYSLIEDVRRSRGEVLALVLVTVVLGLLLGLFTDGLVGMLQQVLTPSGWRVVVVGAGLLTALLTLTAAWLFHGRAESQRACIDLWLPYHFPQSGRPTIASNSAYQPPRHARRAFMHRYRSNAPELKAFLEAHDDAQARGQPFQDFIADDHLALTQCLALYVLHRYADKSLGFEAPYGWWGTDLASQRLSMDDLPAPLCDNPFLRADQSADEWRLLLPEGVTFEATDRRWELRHRRYGDVTIRWHPELAAAGRHSQPYQALMHRMTLDEGSQLYVIGTRIEALVHLRWTLLPASEPFHRWATGLLARLEEALDFRYFIDTLPGRIVRNLDWKIGWVPEGSSIVEMLQTIEGRLDDLEMEAAIVTLEEEEKESRDDFVV